MSLNESLLRTSNIEDKYEQIMSSFFPKTKSNSKIMKDEALDRVYFTNQNCSEIVVASSINYRKFGNFSVHYEIHDIISKGNFFGFSQNNLLKFLAYDHNDFYIIDPSKDLITDAVEEKRNFYKFTFPFQNRDSEICLKMQNIQTETSYNYFIVITNTNNIYFITLFQDQAQNYKFSMELYSYRSIFSSFYLLSYFSYQNLANSEECYILNPFSYSPMKTGNSKTNVLFIFTTQYIKKFSFNIYLSKLEPTMVYEDKGRISKAIKNQINCSKFDIVSCDCNSNTRTREEHILAVIKSQDVEYFLFQIIFSPDSGESVSSIKISQYFEEFDIRRNTVSVVANKFASEYFIFIEEQCIIYINKQINDNQRRLPKEAKLVYRGINPRFGPDGFCVDLFTERKGVKTVRVYNANTEEIELTEKTIPFIRQFCDLLSSEKINQSNVPSQSRSRMNASQTGLSETTAEEQKIISYLNDKIKEFQKDGFRFEEVEEKLKSYSDSEAFFSCISKLVLSIVNDDSLNIQVLDKNEYNAEFVIIDYLNNKLEKVELFYKFLNSIKFFEDKFKNAANLEIFRLIFSQIEKLKIAIQIRSRENEIISAIYSKKSIRKEVIEFFDRFYSQMKRRFVEKVQNQGRMNTQNFSKQLLYGRMENINENFINQFFDTFNEFVRELANNPQAKAELYYVMANIIIDINAEIYKSYIFFRQASTGNKNPFINIKKNEQVWIFNKDPVGIKLSYFRRNFMDFASQRLIDLNCQIFCDSFKTIYELSLSILNLHLAYYDINKTNGTEFKKEYCKATNAIILEFYEFEKKAQTNLDNSFNLALTPNYFAYEALALMCFDNKPKNYPKLVSYMNFLSNKQKIYLLKQILKLELDRVKSNKTEFKAFEFFDDFINGSLDFSEQISEIVSKYPRLESLYNLYLIQKEDVSLPSQKLSEILNHNRIFTEIQDGKIMGPINSCINNESDILVLKLEKIKALIQSARNRTYHSKADAKMDLDDKEISFEDKEMSESKGNIVDSVDINAVLIIKSAIKSYYRNKEGRFGEIDLIVINIFGSVFPIEADDIKNFVIQDNIYENVYSYDENRSKIELCFCLLREIIYVIKKRQIENRVFEERVFGREMFERNKENIVALLRLAISENLKKTFSFLGKKNKNHLADLNDEERRNFLDVSIAYFLRGFLADTEELSSLYTEVIEKEYNEVRDEIERYSEEEVPSKLKIKEEFIDVLRRTKIN